MARVKFTVTSVRFKADKMPRFDFEHQSVRYYGVHGMTAEILVGLAASSRIIPWSWTLRSFPNDRRSLWMEGVAIPGSKEAVVSIRGRQTHPVLLKVRHHATSDRLKVVATLDDVKVILRPYLNLA